jgi:hypothetical protein
MANLNMDFDPGSVEPGQGLDPVPAGEYVAQIIESDVGPAKSGNGLLLNLTWEIVEGPHEHRKFWQRINYQHTSAQAQLIGQQQLKAICDAIGLAGHISDSEQLHFQPMRVRLVIDDSNKNYLPKNEVKAVKPLNAVAPANKPQVAQQPGPAKAAPAAKPAAPAGAARPWGNRATAAPR